MVDGAVLTLERIHLQNGRVISTQARGGTIFVRRSVLRLDACKIVNSSVTGEGTGDTYLGTANPGRGYGGALFVCEGEAQLIGCNLTESHANSHGLFSWFNAGPGQGFASGGVLYVDSSEVRLIGCSLGQSSAKARVYGRALGGAVYLQESSAHILGCTFYHLSISGTNEVLCLASTASGGMVYCTNSSVTLEVCMIRHTSAEALHGKTNGGILALTENSVAGAFRCSMTGCMTGGSCIPTGGAISAEDSGASLMQCFITNTFAQSGAQGMGGGLYLDSSIALLSACNVTNCSSIFGGALYVMGSQLRVDSTVVQHCKATYGAGLYQYSGHTVLSNATLFAENKVTGRGASYMVMSGIATYVLPAPSGHWLPNGRCEVYRAGCPTRGDSLFTFAGLFGLSSGTVTVEDEKCIATVDQCKLLPDNADGSAPSANGTTCQKSTFAQPCDWKADPAQLGLPLYTFPSGYEDQDLPFPCAPGLLGSSSVEDQKSSVCGGQCPAGKL